MVVGDEQVTSIVSWANGLFMGTSPKGLIWVHNFSTGGSYEFVQTGDECVSAFAVWGGRLYAGTSPAGKVYSFDGNLWKEVYTAYGTGITSMVGGDKLYVFMSSAETGVAYDGATWAPLQIGSPIGQSALPTIASFRFATVSPSSDLPNPINPCRNIYSATLDSSDVVFGGQGGTVWRYGSSTLSRAFQTDAGDVTSVVNIGTNMNLAAIGGTVYLVDETQPLTSGGK